MALPAVPVCVGFIVRVTLWAMSNRLSFGYHRHPSGQPNINTPSFVLSAGYRFKVLRVTTMADPAKMVKLQAFRDCPDDQFVRYAVDDSMLASASTKTDARIPIFPDVPSP